MSNYLMMIVLTATLAVNGNPATGVVAGDVRAKCPGVSPRKPSLDKTWTTRGQENEAGSQVLAVTSLTSHGSFPAEGTGVEPSTACAAPDFESQNGGWLSFRYPSVACFSRGFLRCLHP
jgi:hypothetical protein